MSKEIKRIISALFVLMMTSQVFSGGQTDESNNTSKESLSFWGPISSNVTASHNNLGDTPFASELENKTGIKVNYTHPVGGKDNEKEAFSILLAAGNLPDIIEYDWLNKFPGGPEKAISDGYILRLNELIDEYAPNFKKYLEEHPETEKMIKTDEGSIYVFPNLKSEMRTVVGPVVRKDWLDELSLDVPTTIDEWYTMLKAFKEKKGATAPLIYEGWIYNVANAFVGAYGVDDDLFLDENGVVKYGPMEPEYKDFLDTFSKWYAEGLIDANIATADKAATALKMTTGQSGASVTLVGSRMGSWIPAGKELNEDFELVGIPYPTLNKGDIPQFGQMDFEFATDHNAAISGDCENVEVAIRYLDYAWTEEGNTLYNIGIENQSYIKKGDEIVFTKDITENQDNLSLPQAIAKYARIGWGGPFKQNEVFAEATMTVAQRDAVAAWQTEAMNSKIPPITPTREEAERVAAIMTDIKTLQQEYFFKVLLGSETTENFDDFVKQLNDFGVNEVIQITQNAVDRYNNR